MNIIDKLHYNDSFIVEGNIVMITNCITKNQKLINKICRAVYCDDKKNTSCTKKERRYCDKINKKFCIKFISLDNSNKFIYSCYCEVAKQVNLDHGKII